MPASKQPSLRPSHRWQRVHAALIVGHALTVKAKRDELMRCHFRQSDVDGACSVHCLCSVLVILNFAKAEALTWMTKRKYGVPANLWNAFADVYFEGCQPQELVERIELLNLPLRVTARLMDDADLDTKAMQWLGTGQLVMLSFKRLLHRRTNHWALGIGCEGIQIGGKAVADTLLLLDPSGPEPAFRSWNARLRLQQYPRRPTEGSTVKLTTEQRRKVIRWVYDAPEWSPELVVLTSAIRIQRKDVS